MKRRQQGFSLLELMLAFALLTGALGLLIAILGGGLTQVRQSADATAAALHAQSLLDQLGVMGPLQPGSTSGEFADSGFRWELQIEQIEDPAPPLPPDPQAAPIESVGRQLGDPLLYRVQLDVAWGEDDWARSLRFVTVKARYPQQDVLQ
jgi:general secretion pathway protein I